MTRPSPFSVRGRRALVLIKDERELAVLARQLDRLGMTVTNCDPDAGKASLVGIDAIVVDADTLPSKWDLSGVVKAGIPLIALIGTETPSRLKGLLDLEPSCLLVKPLRSAGLYSALVFAFDKALKQLEAAKRIERLEERVRARRIVLAALLEVMRRQELSEPEAFAWIRRAAMEQRTTIERLSVRIVETSQAAGQATRRA